MLCNYDLELAATKYFHSVEDGQIPLTFHINGSLYYPGDDGGLQIVQVPWDTVADYSMDVGVWKRMIDAYYPHRGWVPLERETLEDLRRERARRGLPTFDATLAQLLSESRGRGTADGRRRRRAGQLAALRGLRPLSLHAWRDQERDADPIRDRLSAPLRGVPARGLLRCCGSSACSLRGPRRQLKRRRALSAAPPASATARVSVSIELGPVGLAELIETPVGREFRFEPGDAAGPGPLEGRVRMRAESLGARLVRVRLCVHNSSAPEAPEEMGRGEALGWSLISVHPVLRVEGGRFISPLERDGAEGEAVTGSENVNTWPVLAGEADEAVVGAAIVLPDHPRIAPESLGNLFDNTEIEEALLLHVKTLSDTEREQIGAQDPAVREMIARADSATPEQLLDLHGRLEMHEPDPVPGGTLSVRPTTPASPRGPLDGVTYRRGDRVLLKPRSGGIRTTSCSAASRPPSSGSISTTRTACTSPSPSTAIRGRS